MPLSFYLPADSFNIELWEGQWALSLTLFDDSGLTPIYLDDDFDTLYVEKIGASVTSDTSGTYTAQNMTIGNVYSIDWWLLEGSFASSNYSVTDSGSTGYLPQHRQI